VRVPAPFPWRAALPWPFAARPRLPLPPP
jgi:hypothetical protein